MAGKYIPLEKYLSDLPDSTHEMTLAFEQIEKILADRLPASAYEDRRWRDHETEGNHVSARVCPRPAGRLGIMALTTFVAAQEAGRSMSMDEAIALALALEVTHD